MDTSKIPEASPLPEYPHYSYPAHVIRGLTRSVLWGQTRSFEEDARACIAELRPPLRVLGAENIPQGGSLVITPNHYHRRGFQAQWIALAISASMPAAVHWVMTSEFTFPGACFAGLGMPLSRFLLHRIAHVYGFSNMPPMPPRDRESKARAIAVRNILQYVTRTENAVIALAPEGGDQPDGQLSMPPVGVGRFCLLLAKAGLGFLPVGAYEGDGEFVLNFGQPYPLHINPNTTTAGEDGVASYEVMNHIAPLLPDDLRGDFRVFA